MKKKKNSCSPLDTYNLEKNPGNKKKNLDKISNKFQDRYKYRGLSLDIVWDSDDFNERNKLQSYGVYNTRGF